MNHIMCRWACLGHRKSFNSMSYGARISYIYGAVREIAPLLSPTAVVVTKSTVPVGTGDEIERILREESPNAQMQVVSNPEIMLEGAAIHDFKHPDPSSIGTDDARAREVPNGLVRGWASTI